MAHLMEVAAAQPDRPALVVDGESVTYRRMMEHAGSVAGALDATTARDSLVAVWGTRSASTYTAIIGVLLSGRGYVPLNPSFPLERTLEMVRQAGSGTFVATGPATPALTDLLAALPDSTVVVAPDERGRPAAARSISTVLAADDLTPGIVQGVDPDPDSIAYLLFTSGTTGKPKGIGIPHSRLRAYLDATAEYLDIGPDDRCSQNFALTFDLSVHDLFVTWSSGACLLVTPERSLLAPSAFIKEQRLTSWFSTPTTAAMMLKLRMLTEASFPSLRLSLFCGEALPASVANAWQTAAPNSTVYNLYGPTEATIACTAHRIEPVNGTADPVESLVPIGRPFGETTIAIVDDSFVPAANGQAGELLIGGPQVAPGYWIDPERTAASFVTLDHLEPSGPWYRTGDRAELDDNGVIRYLGRVDDQLKIRGHRVELGEVESVLRRVSGAAAVVAVGWPKSPGGADGIVAFLSGTNADPPDVLDRCRSLLPDYMVPSVVHVVEVIPQNASGKADRDRLIEAFEGSR